MIYKFCLICIICYFIFPSVIVAHPGNTDSSGGHTCRTNCGDWGLEYGEYHYHNGSGVSLGGTSSDGGLIDTGIYYPNLWANEDNQIVWSKMSVYVLGVIYLFGLVYFLYKYRNEKVKWFYVVLQFLGIGLSVGLLVNLLNVKVVPDDMEKDFYNDSRMLFFTVQDFEKEQKWSVDYLNPIDILEWKEENYFETYRSLEQSNAEIDVYNSMINLLEAMTNIINDEYTIKELELYYESKYNLIHYLDLSQAINKEDLNFVLKDITMKNKETEVFDVKTDRYTEEEDNKNITDEEQERNKSDQLFSKEDGELVVTIDNTNNLILVNGIALGSSREDVINTLGDPEVRDNKQEDYFLYSLPRGYDNLEVELYIEFYNDKVTVITFGINKNVVNANWYKDLGKPFATSWGITYFYLVGTEQILMFKPNENYAYVVYADNNFYDAFGMEEKMW